MEDVETYSSATSYLPHFEIRVGSQAQGRYENFKDAIAVVVTLCAIHPAEAITVIDLTSGAVVFDIT